MSSAIGRDAERLGFELRTSPVLAVLGPLLGQVVVVDIVAVVGYTAVLAFVSLLSAASMKGGNRGMACLLC
jgi:hypothetical protein